MHTNCSLTPIHQVWHLNYNLGPNSLTPCCHHLVRYNGCNVDRPYLTTFSLFATLYILTSVMSLPLLSPEGMDVLILNLPLCCHISLPYIMGFEIKIIHQGIQTIRWYASCCHHCHYCNVDFCHTLH